jgi:hypothetical protein
MKRLSVNFKMAAISFILVAVMAFGFTSCNDCPNKDEANSVSQTETETENAISITEQEVLDAQKAWGEGIVKIGNAYSDGGDYVAVATEHINKFYNYDEGSVLFKPTLAAEKQFRLDFQGALSYFVGGDEVFPEDHGFAIKPWSNVRWENVGTKIYDNVAFAMGNYYFTPVEGGDEVKVEYSFAYEKNEDGKLKIILHGSHLPYAPEEKH